MSCNIQPWLFAALLPVAAACGGGSNGTTADHDGVGGNGSTNPTNCHITLSGAVSGTYDCYSTPVAQWTPAIDVTSLAFTSDGSPQHKGAVTITITHSFYGAPTPGTYTSSDENMYGWSVLVFQGTSVSDYHTWEGGSLGMGGTYALTITEVGTATELSGGKTYPIHGSVHATSASAATTDIVTADVTF